MILRNAMLTTFGLGHMRPAPGTWGSLPPPAMVFGLVLLDAPAWLINAALGVVFVVFAVACERYGAWGEVRWGRKDPSHIVADETSAQCIPLLFLPAAVLDAWLPAMLACGLAFLAFRALDIWKPWPARGLQRLRGGWGVLVDDLIAGLYAAALVQAFTRLALPHLGLG